MGTLWFGIDVDGTLTESEGIPKQTQIVLARARQAGACVILASGRRPGYLWRLSQACGLDSPIVALDGAWVEAADGTVVARVPIDADALAMLEVAATALGLKTTKIGEPNLYCKVIVSGPRRSLDQLAENQDSSRIRLVNQFPSAAEWVHAGCSKGSGFEALFTRYGRPDQLIAFGNDWNDREMFELADRAYALPSAPQALQAVADEVLAPIATEPVARVIENLLGGRERLRDA